MGNLKLRKMMNLKKKIKVIKNRSKKIITQISIKTKNKMMDPKFLRKRKENFPKRIQIKMIRMKKKFKVPIKIMRKFKSKVRNMKMKMNKNKQVFHSILCAKYTLEKSVSIIMKKIKLFYVVIVQQIQKKHFLKIT